MEEFSIGRAWTFGYQFVARGTLVHFVILALIGLLAPVGVQYALVGTPMNGASPMAGATAIQMAGVPSILLALVLTHVLQAGSYFASLRFGYTDGQAPAGAIGWGLVAGLIATGVVALGYLAAYLLGQLLLSPGVPGAVILAIIAMMIPLFIVYGMFFLGVAAMIAGTIIVTVAYLFLYGLAMGAPELAAAGFGGSGLMTVIMLLMSVLLFWLAARFSCVLPLMAERGDLNVFSAIAGSWRLTADDQLAITRYVALVGFAVALVIFGISYVIGTSTGGQMGGGLGIGTTGELVLGLVFGTPVAFLSVMMSAGIHRALVGEETSAEIFE